jgi:hypothetical protein
MMASRCLRPDAALTSLGDHPRLQEVRVQGRFISLYQLAITIGIFIASLING